MRGTPGGKQPTEFTVVGFTGSFESSNERGPNEGLVALNFSCAQGVIGGSVALNVHDQYRVCGDPFIFHTPDKSGVFCAQAAGMAQAAAAAITRNFDLPRISASSRFVPSLSAAVFSSSPFT